MKKLILAVVVVSAVLWALPRRACCRGQGGYCGCPNKDKCAEDDVRNCSSCCQPKCEFVNPSVR